MYKWAVGVLQEATSAYPGSAPGWSTWSGQSNGSVSSRIVSVYPFHVLLLHNFLSVWFLLCLFVQLYLYNNILIHYIYWILLLDRFMDQVYIDRPLDYRFIPLSLLFLFSIFTYLVLFIVKYLSLSFFHSLAWHYLLCIGVIISQFDVSTLYSTPYGMFPHA